jgi:hypothetical protein
MKRRAISALPCLKAATHIQAAVRMRLRRATFTALKTAVVTAQAHRKGAAARRASTTLRATAVALQVGNYTITLVHGYTEVANSQVELTRERVVKPRMRRVCLRALIYYEQP